MSQWYTLEEFEADVFSHADKAIFIVWEFESKARSMIDNSVGNNEFTKMMKWTDSIRNLDTTISTLRKKSTKTINLILDYVVYWDAQNYAIEDKDAFLEKFLVKINRTINKLDGFFNYFFPEDYVICFDSTEHKRGYENKKFYCELTLNVHTTDELKDLA